MIDIGLSLRGTHFGFILHGKLGMLSLTRTKQHWYSTGSGSDRAPCRVGVSIGGARSLPLPVLYRHVPMLPGCASSEG